MKKKFFFLNRNLNTACFPGGSEVKAAACNAGDLGLIPGPGRSPGEGNGNPLQYFCLENPMDGGAWWATVHGVAKSWIRLSDNFKNSACSQSLQSQWPAVSEDGIVSSRDHRRGGTPRRAAVWAHSRPPVCRQTAQVKSEPY